MATPGGLLQRAQQRVQAVWQDTKHETTFDKYDLHFLVVDDYREFAATAIQRFYRGFAVREKLRRQARYQQQNRECMLPSPAQQRLDDAARHIQRAWVCFSSRRAFCRLRQLIRAREHEDPRALLRSISPQEATLADAAAGIHVRFRLGGETFPPVVLYKIFTHRPVTDICSFCPRDYAGEMAAAMPPCTAAGSHRAISLGAVEHAPHHQADAELDGEARNNVTPDSQMAHLSTRGWYRRIENNGWRPLAAGPLASGGSAAAGTAHTHHPALAAAERRCAPPFFHHARLVRREAAAQRRKQRRRQWLLQLYRPAPHQSDSSSSATLLSATTDSSAPAGPGVGISEVDALQQARPCGSQLLTACLAAKSSSASQPAGVQGMPGPSGGGVVGDGDAEADPSMLGLLRWATLLDFDSYAEGWAAMAVTAGSEALVPQSDVAIIEHLRATMPLPAVAVVAASC